MRKILSAALLICGSVMMSCNSGTEPEKTAGTADSPAESSAGQSAVKDDMSSKNVVQVAVGSADHTTLVAAIKAAGLVDALSNAGPFTVFAPTNAAFDKLPAGTVDNLLKPEKKDDLVDILQYHVSLGVFKPEMFTEGQEIGQVNGGNIIITKKDGKLIVNGTSTIIASIPASNGIVHVIDGVLLPPPPPPMVK